jgi:hypothetical protein
MEKEEKIPLNGTFMIISILGIVISAVYTFGGTFTKIFAFMGENAGLSFGMAFIFMFIMMFISAVVSITPSFDELKEIK